MELYKILEQLDINTIYQIKKLCEQILIKNKSVLHIRDLDISVRAFNRMESYGYIFLEQLTELTESQFLQLKYMGWKTKDELMGLMIQYNLSFKELRNEQL